MDQAFREWSHDELSKKNDSWEESESQFVDNGSISFGRFASESLSWEKWSVFSHNKCQEELDKFKAPGLVAQKKAYFEEYYKRVRALKALQQDQQAASGLDTSGNDSVCSQINKEQTASQGENAGEEKAPSEAQPEENIVGVTMEQEIKSKDDHQPEYLETDSMVSCPNSTVITSNGRIEEIRQLEDDCNNFSDEMISNNDDRSNISVVEKKQRENNCNSLRDEEIMIKRCSSISASKTEAGARTTTKLAATKQRGSRVTLANGSTTKKVEPNNKKYKVQASVHTTKETVAGSMRNDVKLNHRKANTSISADGLKFPLQKTVGNTETTSNSRNPSTHRVSSNNNSTSTSNRTLTGGRSNHNHPDRLPTVRQAVPASIRDSRSGHSNLQAMRSNARLPVQRKWGSNIQNMSIEATVPRGMTNAVLGLRRNQEAVSKSMVLDSGHTTSKGRDADVARLKSISSRLPAQSKSNQSGLQFGLQSNEKAEKQNEVKEQEVPRKFSQSSKPVSPTTPSILKTRNLKPEHNKKALSFRSTVDLMQSGGKPRQGIPQWR